MVEVGGGGWRWRVVRGRGGQRLLARTPRSVVWIAIHGRGKTPVCGENPRTLPFPQSNRGTKREQPGLQMIRFTHSESHGMLQSIGCSAATPPPLTKLSPVLTTKEGA